MKRNINSKRTFIILFLIIFAGALIPSRFVVSTSASLEHRIFILNHTPDVSRIKKGSYVVFYLDESDKFYGGKRLIKRVSCDEGSVLKVTEKMVFYREGKETKKELRKQYFCDGEYLGEALTHTSKGDKLSNFVYNGKIPEGYVFVTGTHPRSYDSRYWGLLKKTDIIALAYPVY